MDWIAFGQKLAAMCIHMNKQKLPFVVYTSSYKEWSEHNIRTSTATSRGSISTFNPKSETMQNRASNSTFNPKSETMQNHSCIFSLNFHPQMSHYAYLINSHTSDYAYLISSKPIHFTTALFLSLVAKCGNHVF